jgi:spermidine synthase
MQDCSYNSDVRIGDARLKFQDVQKNSQDYIIVDAFSSDSIPAHLVNKEALELYRSRLKPGGLIFFHTSNRVLDVSSVVVNLAENANLDSRFIKLRDFEDYPYSKYVAPSDAVIVGSAKQMEALSESDEKWRRYIASPDVGLWSDDYSHILGTLKASYKKNAQILPNNPDEILE